MIYFDNAATTYPKPECVYVALDKAQREYAFNAGRGVYHKADEASKIIEKTRDYLCSQINANQLIFTASATHAINQIINGIDFKEGDIVYCSPYDHNAIVRTLHSKVQANGIELKIIPLNSDKTIDLKKFEFECMFYKPKAIFATHVSNVTGYILPIKEIGEIARLYNSVFVVDGAQAFGLVDVDMKKYNIFYYVFAGHKTLYGPFGIAGFFANNNGLKLSFFGGTGSESLNLDMPANGTLRFEPSSPNVVAIAGLYEAAKHTFENNSLEHEKELFKYAIDKLSELDDLIIYNNKHIEGTGIISFNLEGYSSDELAKILSEEYDICVRGGYHCCPFIHDYIDTKQYYGTVRISFSCFNTKEEIDLLIEAIEDIELG